jgi:hypothetical protein
MSELRRQTAARGSTARALAMDGLSPSHGAQESIEMADEGANKSQPTGITFWVNSIVAVRNHQPYVQLSNDKGMIGQFTVAEARNVAQDLMIAASRAEADAMIWKFFRDRDLPQQAAAALMQDFRDFRHTLDMEQVEKAESDPDTGRKV